MNRKLAWLLILSIAFTGCCLIGSMPAAFADDIAIRGQLDSIDAALKERCDSDHLSPDSCDNFPLDLPQDDGRAVALLHQMWALLETRSLQFFQASPSPNLKDFAEIIGKLGNFDADAANLTPNSLLARINYRDWLGDVFIASKMNGHTNVVWRLRDLTANDFRNFPDLTIWAPWEVQHKICQRLKDNGFCQPFGPVSMATLPDSATGAHRFYIEAIRLQETSCFLREQLSIWEWNGRNVIPLLAKSYPIDCDDSPIRVDGNLIHIRVKRNFHTMWVSGAGPGREMDWKVAVEPGGLKDLGETPEAPDIDLIDDALNRVARNANATRLASSSAITFLKQNFVAPGKQLTIGYDGYRSAITTAGTVYCLPLDIGTTNSDKDGTYAFTVTKKGQSDFLSQVQKLDDSNVSGVCGR